MADGARSLPYRQMGKVIKQVRDPEPGDPLALLPDQMKLYSYYKPSLEATNYVVNVKQTITATSHEDKISHSEVLVVENSKDQEFEVVVPHFTLDPDLINSYYPPDGHQDEGRILPHIVLNDPHYPWEIPAGTKPNMDGPIDKQTIKDPSTGKDKAIYRNMVPWIALMVFDAEDLHIPTLTDIKALNIPGFTTEDDMKKQNPVGTYSMSVKQYLKVPPSSRINYVAGFDGENDPDYQEIVDTPGLIDVIFPTKTLFNQFFPDLESIQSYKYLSHVRHINTIGFPDAGVEEDGLFSITVSGRTGQYDITQPRIQICHLVSIEHVDSTIGAWSATGLDRIGLVSLHSWTYTALPPDPINFVEMMKSIVSQRQMLRTNDALIKKLQDAPKTNGQPNKTNDQLVARLNLGYTIARWRTELGEETAAWNRGPLVPQPVIWPPNATDLRDSSSTSKEFQILDPQTGLMDLSYSSAWQTGKLLAISDTVFSAALMRLRSHIYNTSGQDTLMTTNAMDTSKTLIARLVNTVSTITSISGGNTGAPTRLIAPGSQDPIGFKDPKAIPVFYDNVNKQTIATSTAGDVIYNEFNKDGPNNSDWTIVHSWLCEKLFLNGIPPQQLIPEPSFQPPESLRFFHIDDFWLDCLIDGALSVANHLDPDDDVVRREIKRQFNTYLSTPVPDAGYIPQIPSYGFILRTKIVKAMPDMRITVKWKTKAGDPPDKRAAVCRWTKWDEQTLLCLLDRQPEELDSITLAQPPHQQRFSLGSHLTKDELTFVLRRLYTQNPPDSSWPEKPMTTAQQPKVQTWFDHSTRIIKLKSMAADINDFLQFDVDTKKRAYIDPKMPNACEFGLELNDPSYYFEIVSPTGSGSTVTPRARQIYINDAKPSNQPSTPGTANAGTVGSATGSQGSIPNSNTNSSSQQGGSLPPAPRIQSTVVSGTAVQTSSRLPGPNNGVGTSTKQARYDLMVWPDYKGIPNRVEDGWFDPNDFVPTKNKYFFDLIFGIRKKAIASASKYNLLGIRIDIPIVPAIQPKLPRGVDPPEALLNAHYDGPGVRMLSNQRFIPFLFNQKDTMYIELIPRTADDKYALMINDKRSQELSFRLAEANISDLKFTTPTSIKGMRSKDLTVGQVLIYMTEVYQSSAAGSTGETVVTPYWLIKKATPDDPPYLLASPSPP